MAARSSVGSYLRSARTSRRLLGATVCDRPKPMPRSCWPAGIKTAALINAKAQHNTCFGSWELKRCHIHTYRGECTCRPIAKSQRILTGNRFQKHENHGRRSHIETFHARGPAKAPISRRRTPSGLQSVQPTRMGGTASGLIPGSPMARCL
jgi:hypothetical protein